MQESIARYRREQELMLGAIHNTGMRTARQHLSQYRVPRPTPSSWLGAQRKMVTGLLSANVSRSLYLQASHTLQRV